MSAIAADLPFGRKRRWSWITPVILGLIMSMGLFVSKTKSSGGGESGDWAADDECADSVYYDTDLGYHFPDESCTGVQDGITLTPFSGTLTTTSNGQLIENLEITGRIVVAHSNVTIRNVKLITSSGVAISNIGAGSSSYTAEHIEIDGTGHTSGSSAIDWRNYTLRYANIHHYGEGPGCEENVVIEWSYLHDFLDVSGTGAHQDGIQCEFADGVTIRHNTIVTNTTIGGTINNASLVFGGDASDSTAEYNIFSGGGYTIYQGQAGGTYRRNRWLSSPAAVFGPVYPANLDGPWTPEDPCDNRWYDGPNAGQAVDDGGPLTCTQP